MVANSKTTSIPAAPTDLLCDFHQEIGAVSKDTPQEDCARKEKIRTTSGQEVFLAVVCDGEGVKGGERASEAAIRTIFNACKGYDGPSLPAMLKQALDEANRAVIKIANDERLNVRASATIAAIAKDTLYLGHIGHSRAYLAREGESLRRLTTDHTQGEDLVRAGKIKAEDLPRTPKAYELSKALGLGPDLQADVTTLELKRGDHLLLCTDGLTKFSRDGKRHFVEEKEMPSILGKNAPLEAARTLVSLSVGRNSQDNVTALVIEMPGAARLKKSYTVQIAVGVSILLALALGVFVILQGSKSANCGQGEFYLKGDVPKDILVISGKENKGATYYCGTRITVGASDSTHLFFDAADANGKGGALLSLGGGAQLIATYLAAHAGDSQTTLLTLTAGRMLVNMKNADHALRFTLTSDKGTVELTLDKGSAAGIEATASGWDVYCLAGTCQATAPAKTLNAKDHVAFAGGKAGEAEVFDDAKKNEWGRLCGAPLSPLDCKLP